MVLICNCDHLRSEHEGGKTSYNDYRVENCHHHDCTCKSYHADKKTQKRKTELWLASLAVPAIVGVLCVIGFGISWAVIDYSFQDFTITSEFEYKTFQNGEEVEPNTFFGSLPIEPGLRLEYTMIMLIGLIFLIFGMFGGLLAGMSYHEKRYFELIKEEK